MRGCAFFGADKMLFATDYPYPGAKSDVAIGDVITSVDLMNVTEEQKAAIFSKNARRLLRLS